MIAAMLDLLLALSTSSFAASCPDVGSEHLLGRHRCPTAALEAARRTAGCPSATAPLTRAAPGGEKTVRSTWEYSENRYETDDLVIWWGTYEGFNDADIERLANAFATGWSGLLDLGYPLPEGTDSFKLNIYIAGTGAGPRDTSEWVAGYMTHDGQGYPYIVMGSNTLGTEQGDLTAVHELFHASQYAVDTYDGRNERSLWWFEATAVWFEGELHPELDGHADNLVGWAFRPELPLNFFDYPDSGDFTEGHQYGAFIWPRYLSDFHGGAEIVRRSWFEAEADDRPLDVVADLLAEEGVGAAEAYFDFAARAATWDFPLGDTYENAIQNGGGFGSSESARPSGFLELPTESMVRPIDELPGTYGANYWELRSPSDAMVLSFEGYPGPNRWYAAVIGQTGDEHVRVELPLIGGAGAATLLNMHEHEELWLVVAAVDSPGEDDTFSYGFTIEDLTLKIPEGGEEGTGCGCASSSSGAAWLWLLSAGATLRRRSRSR